MNDKMKKPSHRVFAIRPRGEGKKDFWTEIGCLWENRDGSFNIGLELTPTDPKTTLQARPFDEPKPKNEE